jgi:hypothetical protein
MRLSSSNWGENLVHYAKRLTIVVLFGVLIFMTKTLIPSPLNKMLIVAQALLLALGTFLVKNKGATLISLVGGFLTALWNVALAPFTLFFALLYGFLVDISFSILRVKVENGDVKSYRIVAAMTLSTMLVGLLSYYVTVHLIHLIPSSLLTEVMILIMGTISGALGGYLASFVWNHYLKDIKI